MLSNHQKAYLAQLAARAWRRHRSLAAGQGRNPDADPLLACQTGFRHHHTAQAAGKLGLRCCSQTDFKLVEAHFLDLLGQPDKALNSMLQAATEPRRIAEHKLIQECQRAGFHISYADKICRTQNRGLTLNDVDAKTLWRLVYTIRNRAAARKAAAPALAAA